MLQACEEKLSATGSPPPSFENKTTEGHESYPHTAAVGFHSAHTAAARLTGAQTLSLQRTKIRTGREHAGIQGGTPWPYDRFVAHSGKIQVTRHLHVKPSHDGCKKPTLSDPSSFQSKLPSTHQDGSKWARCLQWRPVAYTHATKHLPLPSSHPTACVAQQQSRPGHRSGSVGVVVGTGLAVTVGVRVTSVRSVGRRRHGTAVRMASVVLQREIPKSGKRRGATMGWGC